MELAKLTDAFLVITIYDPTEFKATTFQSHENNTLPADSAIVTHERFFPDDVSSTYNFRVSSVLTQPLCLVRQISFQRR